MALNGKRVRCQPSPTTISIYTLQILTDLENSGLPFWHVLCRRLGPGGGMKHYQTDDFDEVASEDEEEEEIAFSPPRPVSPPKPAAPAAMPPSGPPAMAMPPSMPPDARSQ